MKCWLCYTDVDEKNSSGEALGKLKNECNSCHNLYNLADKFRKLSDQELYIRINRALRIEDLCELVKNNRNLSATEIVRIYLEGE